MTIKLHGLPTQGPPDLMLLRKTEAGLQGEGEVGPVWGSLRKDHRARLALFLHAHGGDGLLCLYTHSGHSRTPENTWS